MRHAAIALLLIAAPLAAVHAQSMPISTFLAKADALQKKGAMALFSSDVGLLKKEIQYSGKALRAQQVAAKKAGGKPVYCMPAKATVSSGELLTHLRSLPPAQRSQPIQAGVASLMRKKYPCPA